jgi:hypothetical protein
MWQTQRETFGPLWVKSGHQRMINFCRCIRKRMFLRADECGSAKNTLSRNDTCFPVTLLFVLHAYATDLNGAWANDPNVCAQIFVRKNNKTLLAEHADLYGRGLIFDGDQVTDQLITCRIKDRKTDSNTVRLLADCSTDLGKFTSRLILRIDDDNRLTRFLEGMPGMGLAYFRCPASK